MTDNNEKLTDRDFQNYQRILSSHPATILTILGFYLTFNASAFVGIYTISLHSKDHPWYWLAGLSFLIIFITLILFIVWLREHALSQQVKAILENAGVKFPNPDKWTGVTYKSYLCLYCITIFIWTVFLGFCICKVFS